VLRFALVIQRSSLAVLTLLCLPVVASAQRSGDEADELIRKGVELRRRGDDRAALGVLQEAYAAAPTPRAAGQLALAEQALGHWVAAEGHLNEVFRSPSDPWVRKNRSSLTEALQTVRTHLGRLAVTGDPPAADVYVDGQLVGKLPLADPVRVAAGSVEVELRAPGFVTAGKTVVVRSHGYEQTFVGLFREAPLPLAPVAQAAPPGAAPTVVSARAPAEIAARDGSPSTARRASYKWIAWGACAIGLGVGTYGVIENGQRSDAFNAAGCRLDSHGAAVLASTRAYDANCNSLKNSYESATTIGVIGFVAGGVLAAAGAVLWFTEPKSANDGVALQSCRLGVGSGSELAAACAFRF
jgi:hypothetical protein